MSDIITGFESVVRFSACGAKGLGVSSNEVVDKCSGEMSNYTELCSFVMILLFIYCGAKIIRRILRWNRRRIKCVKAANAIAKYPNIAACLAKMTRKDAKFQINSWKKSLNETKTEQEFQELKQSYIHQFSLADELAGKYSFS
jgi:hypothetical protein